MMQLLGNPASPYVRKVRVVLEETGQVDEVERIDVATSVQDTVFLTVYRFCTTQDIGLYLDESLIA